MKKFITTILAATFTLLGATAYAGEKDENGLHIEPWIRSTFLDLREDLEEANAEGKRMMIMISQRGCIYCDRMHEKTFIHEEIADLITDNYFVVRINLHGSTEVTDFDGETLTEAQMARKWGMLFTPTMIFLPTEVSEDKSAVQAQVAMVPGQFGPYTTYNMFQWVLEEGYNNDAEDFQRYHAREWVKLRDQGYFQ